MKIRFKSRRAPVARERGFPRRQQAMMLIDCLAYIALLAIILGLTFSAFYRVHENSQNLNRNAADIARTLHVGERWREEVRTSSEAPRREESNGVSILRLPRKAGDVLYAFRDAAIFRQEFPGTNWVMVLPAVASSVMSAETRREVRCWHWDVELQGRQKVARVRPVFSFTAVDPNPPPP